MSNSAQSVMLRSRLNGALNASGIPAVGVAVGLVDDKRIMTTATAASEHAATVTDRHTENMTLGLLVGIKGIIVGYANSTGQDGEAAWTNFVEMADLAYAKSHAG